MLDTQRWQRLWQRLGARGDGSDIFAQLQAAYAEPHRAYHNAAHIADCLAQFDGARELARRPDEIEAAIWFHDAVYDPRAADNEERSAEWASDALRYAGIGGVNVDRVTNMIRATRHDGQPVDADTGLLLDIDLSILGREPNVFAAYDRAVREEYHWVNDASYRAGRAGILSGFLNRPAIYSTRQFRERFESQARQNLERAIAALRQ